MTSTQPQRAGLLSEIPKNVWVATLTSFLTDISSEMITNLIPLFLANVLGVSTVVIGLIDGVAETTSSLLKGISGWLSDKLQERKWVAVAGYALSALSKPLLYFASAWTGVLAVRFADRAGKGIRTSPRDALIADSVNEHRRGLAFGLHRAGDTAGAAIGLIIALLVVLATQAQALDLSAATFRTIVLIGVVPGLLAVVVLAIGARDVEIKPAALTVRLNFGSLSRNFKIFLLIIAIFTLGNSSDSFLILLAQQRGLNVAGVLGMLITFNAIYALFSGPLGALSDRLGRQRVIIGGWLVYGLLYLGFAAADSAWQIWLLYGLYGLYYAGTEGTAKALVADLVPAEQRGTAYGWYNAVVGLVALPASLIAGILWQGIGGWQGLGSHAPFLFGSALAVLASLLLVWQRRNQRFEVSQPV
ncbi:MAG: MFS transporter [Anaerolineae bacterium]|nr:MFS transporter [Anaerolineae bacterium]